MSDSEKKANNSLGDLLARRTAPPETDEARDAARIAALTGGYVMAHAPWVYFPGANGDDLARCDVGEFIALEILVTCDEACALLERLRELRGGRSHE